MLKKRMSSATDVAGLLSASLLAAERCAHRYQVFDQALRRVPATGLLCEFGVFEAESTNYIARHLPGRRLYGFDSFEGLPETWRPEFEAGMFSTGGRLPQVERNVSLIKGWFDETLPRFAAEHPGPVAMLHIDCDLYSSTRCVFDHLGERIGPGAILVFDEFFNYPGWEEHEFRAFSEFVRARRLSYEYLCYNGEHEQVAVRITG
jgi:predicted O-methyltransferase YrrM